MDLFYRIFAVW